MTQVQQSALKFEIKIDGAALDGALDQALLSAFVDDSLNLPDMFQLNFRDPARTVLAQTGAKVGSKVTIAMASGEGAGPEKLLEGEVTALDFEYDSGGSIAVIRGFDTSHRLSRGRRTHSYTQVTYSDIAQTVASRAGLQIGQIDPAPTVHDHVSQANLTDWQFLKGLAGELGYEMGCVDGKFEFRKPRDTGGAPGAGDLEGDDPLELTLGSTLLRFRATATAAEQVRTVKVRGWDWRNKQELIGQKDVEAVNAVGGVTPAELAQPFSTPDFVGVTVPFMTQSEVDEAARSIAEQIAGASLELEGVARGNPKLKAGTKVSLAVVPPPFEGRYVVTTTRHVYDPKDGYTVWFTVSGKQERSLYGLASGGGGARAHAPISGVVPAIVTDVKDPEDLGRVKVKFPWLDDQYATDWARMVQLSAGADRGSVLLPEVNDEVLVAFEQGDVRRPYVLGGLYNGKDKPDLGQGLVDASGAVKRRGFISKNGHKLVFLDAPGKSGVMLATNGNSMRIALKETGTTIRINSQGMVEIEANGNVSIKAGGRMELKASAGMTIDGGAMVELKGGVVRIN